MGIPMEVFIPITMDNDRSNKEMYALNLLKTPRNINENLTTYRMDKIDRR
ncbi:9053_t:CDS:2 [Funneliformis geosporum]|nr:9053_t:CDS:2 [Funneliformis geosporum]